MASFFTALKTVVGLFIIAKIVGVVTKKMRVKKLMAKAKAKLEARDQALKSFKMPTLDLKPEFKEELLRADAATLLEYLKSGKVTSYELTVLFIQRAATIGRELEIITELNFEEALAQAKACDEQRKKDPKSCKGELFGLPISVKDCFNLKGKESTIGSIRNIGNHQPDDGLTVKILKSEGAIIMYKTNVPQLMLMCESGNFIWGRSKNPWNKDRTVGGSSGGESGAISAGLSPLGIGSDIGGSGRIPGTFCGIVSYKPSHELICFEGSTGLPETRGNLAMRVVYTPMGKTVEDINILMKALMNGEYFNNLGPYTGNAYHQKRKWNEDATKDNKKLVIGYMKSHKLFPVTTCMQRAVDESVAALEKKGHKLIPIEFPDYEEYVKLWFQNCSLGGVYNVFQGNLKGEPTIPEYADTLKAASLPEWLKPVAGAILKLVGEKRKAKLTGCTKHFSGHELLMFNNKMAIVKRNFLKIWEDNKMEALIMPGMANPAFKHTFAGRMNLAMSYTFIFNVLNCPAGAVPISVVKAGEDNYSKDLCPINDSYYRAEVENMKDSVGLPTGVQVIGLPYQDEKCISVMRQLEEEIQFFKKHPLPYGKI